MIKRIVIFVAILIAAFLSSYFIHSSVIDVANYPYSLFNVYLFHVVAATIVYLIIEGVFTLAPNKAGYLYLAAIFVKIGFFVLIFNETIINNEELVKIHKVSLIIPLFLFLIIEAIGVSRVLNSK